MASWIICSSGWTIWSGSWPETGPENTVSQKARKGADEGNGARKGTGHRAEQGAERNRAQSGTGLRKGVRDSGREQRTGKDRKTNQ